jgi:hypothetical protein
MRCTFAILFAAPVLSSPVSAENFDGRYDGDLLLTRDGGDCGDNICQIQLSLKRI